jgi:hypothetical protein
MDKMNSSLFDWYKATKKLLCISLVGESEKQIDELKQNIISLEAEFPELQKMYENYQLIVNSFTPEQKDFICYEIGDWYLKWKDCIASKNGTHRLGYAKEQLKSILCGEE